MCAVEAPTNSSARDLWDTARSQLRLQLPRSTYETWVRDTECLAHEDGAFVIGVGNAYAKDWLSLRLRPLIKRTLAGIVGRTVEVTFVVQTTPAADDPDAPPVPLLAYETPDEPAMAEPEPGEPTPARPAPAGPQIAYGAELSARYSFDTFIVGPSNRMAHASALAVSERPGTAYNPLFLYGDSGLGKTHLLQAIGHTVQAMGKRVLYVTSEVFTNDLINAIRMQATDQFRSKYRTIDVLLLDDVHFIAGKEQTQEEFFHTFNALHAANRQIVMTSDRPPQAIPTLEERLRSRFGWGMIADIQPPNLEMRIAILQAKAASLGRDVPNEILHLIAQRAYRNIRDMEGALNKVLAHAEFFHRPLDARLVEDALAYLAPAQSKLSLDAILEIAAEYFGVTVEDLKGRSRSARIALQRQMVMYIMREATGASLPQIAQVLGGRDHTTILHGYERVSNELNGDPDLARTVNDLRNRLYEPVRVRQNGYSRG